MYVPSMGTRVKLWSGQTGTLFAREGEKLWVFLDIECRPEPKTVVAVVLPEDIAAILIEQSLRTRTEGNPYLWPKFRVL